MRCWCWLSSSPLSLDRSTALAHPQSTCAQDQEDLPEHDLIAAAAAATKVGVWFALLSGQQVLIWPLFNRMPHRKAQTHTHTHTHTLSTFLLLLLLLFVQELLTAELAKSASLRNPAPSPTFEVHHASNDSTTRYSGCDGGGDGDFLIELYVN